MKKRPLKILLFSRDPGPTNQLLAFYKAFSEYISLDVKLAFIKKYDLSADVEIKFIIFAKQYAHQVWASENITFIDWKYSNLDQDFASKVSEVLDNVKPDFVVTGVEDVDERDHKIVWAQSREKNIPVNTIFDCHRHADLRLVDQKTGDLFVPDAVFIPDQSILEILLQQKIPKNRIILQRNLYLQYLELKKSETRKHAQDCLWDKKEDEFIFLFVSENQTEMEKAGRRIPYSELFYLEKFIQSVRDTSLCYKQEDWIDKNIRIIIRPHPRDTVSKYDKYTFLTDTYVELSSSGSPQEAILSADLIVGMNSMLLREAEVMNLDVLSLIDYFKNDA